MTWLLLAEAAVPEGGLFDLDATLPLMAVQVVLLTFLLNSLFFRPVGKVMEGCAGVNQIEGNAIRNEVSRKKLRCRRNLNQPAKGLANRRTSATTRP